MPATTFIELMQEADKYRTRRNFLGSRSKSLSMAISHYAMAYNNFPENPQRWMAAQQCGVSFRMKHMCSQALSWLRLADRRAPDDLARANIMRDMAAAYSDLGSFDEAAAALNQSLRLLGWDRGRIEHPIEWAATTYFMARLLMRQNNLPAAKRQFWSALSVQVVQNSEDARMQELYLRLHLGECLVMMGEAREARKCMWRAIKLVPSYGSPAHGIKAIFIWAFAGNKRVVQWKFKTIRV